MYQLSTMPPKYPRNTEFLDTATLVYQRMGGDRGFIDSVIYLDAIEQLPLPREVANAVLADLWQAGWR